MILLCDLTHMGQGIAVDTFPLGIGCIASYLEAHDIPAEIVKFPDSISHIPKIVGLSSYAWNSDLARQMAKVFKKKGAITIFGGPNFPLKNQKEFLKSNPMIDFYIEGEGEKAMLSLVRNLQANNYDIDKVKPLHNPSVRTIYKDKFIQNPIAPRIDLDEIPSPYLTGKMDKFFELNLRPLVQTKRGCPFSCTYCVEGTSYYNRITRRDAREELEYIAQRSKNKQLMIADSNFGMFEDDIETAKVLRETMEKYGFPSYIIVGTGKNEKVLDVARTLKGRIRLSGSVQSLDKKVLKAIKRTNIPTQQILNFGREARKIGANGLCEIILGLPYDSLKAHFDAIERVIKADFNVILSYTFMILKGTELETQDLERRYRILPRCFGTYPFVSAEVEEIHISMPFEDYLECRLFDLTVQLFYNDRIFEDIIGKVDIFEWLKKVHKRGLKQTYENFRRDTINELWDSEEELRAFFKENIKEYAEGRLGNNLIYYYRVKVFLNHMKELNDIAYDCAGIEGKEVSLYRRINIFSLDDIEINIAEKPYRFYHTEEQKKMIRAQLDLYGYNEKGMTKALARLPLNKLWRRYEALTPEKAKSFKFGGV